MRNLLVFMLAFLVLFSLSFAKSTSQNVQPLTAKTKTSLFQAQKPSSLPENANILVHFRTDTLIWHEDFESGATGWMSVDETDVGIMWHQDDWMAHGGAGDLSWWMADTTLGNNGGYLSHWYQVLDTPDITLSGSPTLTFYHRLSCEPPAGATSPYDGWDGVNVRISTDGGATWTVLQNPTPAYTANSLYSFGYEFGEGPNVPGWAGAILNWTQVTFDLSAYTGQTVRIRFAFASDPAYDTSDDPTMFGWQVDDIVVADGSNILYSNDGTQADMTAQNWAPLGGDYWHIATDPTAPSPTHIADSNDPATGTYHPNMIDSYISPYFYVSDTLSEAYLDFALQGTFDDNNTFPDVDYFGVFVQVKGEAVWRYVSNLTMNPNNPNYVYSSAPTSWAWFSESYSSGTVDLSPLLGDTLRVKFTFYSDDDAPIGTALQVDDVIVWHPATILQPPTNLAATAGDGYVDLVWDDLNVSGHQVFVYDDGTFENGIHVTSGTADAGTYFNSPAPATIDTLWVYGSQYNTSTTATIKVWDASGGSISNTPLYTKTVTLVQNQWNVYDLTSENWTVPGDFVAGIEITPDISITLDENTVPSQHSWVFLGSWSTWASVAAANGLPDGEWGVRAAVTYSSSTNITYNVYRRLQSNPNYGSAIATGLTSASYHDASVTNGETYCYVVTAVYPGQGESDYSNEVCATPMSSTIYEMAYDDGTAESFYPVGTGNYVAVRFRPIGWPTDVVKIKVYFKDPGGTAQFVIFDDDGANGYPGTQLYAMTKANLDAGWNEVDVTGITINDGEFYAGVRFTPLTKDIGIDESLPFYDKSYIKISSGDWSKFSDLGLNYNVMIRVMLDSANVVGISGTDPNLIREFSLEQNYPNPFNPTTTIRFAIPADMSGQQVTLKVFDLLGREINTLVNGRMNSGYYQVTWDGRDMAGNPVTSGIYFYTIKAGDKVQTRKMILMK